MKFEKIGGADSCWRAKTPEQKIAKIQQLLTRPIQWDMILCFKESGRKLTCELCGNEDFGRYYCKPCIHHTWCCECCILLGIPNYQTGVYVVSATKPAQST